MKEYGASIIYLYVYMQTNQGVAINLDWWR